MIAHRDSTGNPVDPAQTGLQPIRINDDGFLREHFVLPPLPAVSVKLLETLKSGNATAAQVAELLTADPGLVAQVLKIVNSAYYGLPREITEARHAVAYLGLAEIERVVVTATVIDTLAPEDTESFEQFWLHSFYAALIAKRLCSRFARGIDAEELRTAVLLHDIGKLVYMKLFPEHFAVLTGHVKTHKVMYSEAERAFDMPSHSDFGVILCERWRLPDSVRRACERHEIEHLAMLDEDDPMREEAQIICLANLAANLSVGDLDGDTRDAIQDAIMLTLGIEEQDFLLLMGELYELRAEAERFLRQL